MSNRISHMVSDRFFYQYQRIFTKVSVLAGAIIFAASSLLLQAETDAFYRELAILLVLGNFFKFAQDDYILYFIDCERSIISLPVIISFFKVPAVLILICLVIDSIFINSGIALIGIIPLVIISVSSAIYRKQEQIIVSILCDANLAFWPLILVLPFDPLAEHLLELYIGSISLIALGFLAGFYFSSSSNRLRGVVLYRNRAKVADNLAFCKYWLSHFTSYLTNAGLLQLLTIAVTSIPVDALNLLARSAQSIRIFSQLLTLDLANPIRKIAGSEFSPNILTVFKFGGYNVTAILSGLGIIIAEVLAWYTGLLDGDLLIIGLTWLTFELSLVILLPLRQIYWVAGHELALFILNLGAVLLILFLNMYDFFPRDFDLVIYSVCIVWMIFFWFGANGFRLVKQVERDG